MDIKDYYSLLNIDKTATADEIKKAYRKLAMVSHPDVNMDKDADEKFKAIGEAYMVLGDTEKRRIYDQTGHTEFIGSGNASGNPHSRNVREPCMGKCSGLDALFSRGARYARQKRGTHLNTETMTRKGIQ